METYDILIVGAGAAGIAAAKSAAIYGGSRILLLDRKPDFGGILLQCAHFGFGNDLNGPQYAASLLADLPETITCFPNTTLVSATADRKAEMHSPVFGKKTVSFKQLILASGCLEIPFGALPIAGTRPAGIYTAGDMQELRNLHGHTPEGPVVILGSGDIGLIMAAHLASDGLQVTLIEQKDCCGGLTRNQRCLQDYPIRLLCSTTVTETFGKKQLEGVCTSKGEYIPCRTLLIAAGLRPDQSLVRHLGKQDWIHLCGNCHKVHPMVEGVVSEGKAAGKAAAEKIRGAI